MSQLLYDGPPALTAGRMLTSWTFDPLADVTIVVLATSYVAGVRLVHWGGGQWPTGRTVCFLGLGLGSLTVATGSWIGVYAHALFWVYALQIIVLLVVTPMFLALGGPISLASHVLSSARRERLERWLNSRLAKLVTFPVLSSLLIATFPFLIYFTGWYELSLRHYVVYELLHVVLVIVGFVFVWPLAGVDFVPRRLPYATVMLIAAVELLFDAFPGIIIRLRTHLIAPDYYTQLGRPWGHSLLADQRLGGGVLWFAGEIAALPLLAIMGVQWVRADRTEAEEVDRQLDLIAPTSASESAEHPDLVAPWWETDPSRLGERGRRYLRDHQTEPGNGDAT